MTPEAKAREQIDKKLQESGWVIQDIKTLNPGGMKRLPDEAGGAPAVEDPASMKPVE